jgi:hypothetical protein
MLARMWGNRSPHTLLMGMQIIIAIMENSMQVPQKLKTELPYDPAVPLLRIYLKEYKSGYNKGTCIPMFIAV